MVCFVLACWCCGYPIGFRFCLPFSLSGLFCVFWCCVSGVHVFSSPLFCVSIGCFSGSPLLLSFSCACQISFIFVCAFGFFLLGRFCIFLTLSYRGVFFGGSNPGVIFLPHFFAPHGGKFSFSFSSSFSVFFSFLVCVLFREQDTNFFLHFFPFFLLSFTRV